MNWQEKLIIEQSNEITLLRKRVNAQKALHEKIINRIDKAIVVAEGQMA